MAKSPKPSRPPRARAPRIKAAWTAFLLAHPQPYTAAFAKLTPLPKGVTLTKLVQQSLGSLASGPWETLSARVGGKSLVMVAFAQKADFDRANIHHNGRPWASTVVGARGGFQVVLP